MKGSFAALSLQSLRRTVLTRGMLALATWCAFSGYNESHLTFGQAVSASDLREIKDLNSFRIRVSFSAGVRYPFYYSFSISGDGKFEYNGHEGAFIGGLHRSRLSKPEVQELLDAIRLANFYSLKDESAMLAMDGGSTTIEVSIDGHSRTVTDRSDRKDFVALFQRILEITHARRWFEETPDTLPAVLADKEDLNSPDLNGTTVLMWECIRADVPAVRALIRAGADLNARDSQGRTALMYAAEQCSLETVRSLVEAGADQMVQDNAGSTALRQSRREPPKLGQTRCASIRRQIIDFLQTAHSSRSP